jgi:hypothetical protein
VKVAQKTAGKALHTQESVTAPEGLHQNTKTGRKTWKKKNSCEDSEAV